MNEPAREAADQLVRLTRLVLRSGGPPALVPPDEPDAGTRTLRHNRATLTARETQVFGRIVAGRCNALLAELLDLPERAMEQHLAALLAEFELPETPPRPTAPAPPPGRGRIAALLLVPVTGTVLIGGAAAAFALQSPDPQSLRTASARSPRDRAAARSSRDRATERQAADRGAGRRPLDRTGAHPPRGGADRAATVDQVADAARPTVPVPRPAPSPSRQRVRLPAGTATATSFWDQATARGARMSYRTVASPYWPLGTRVRIAYHGHTVTGLVEDFGPAAWAIAQHDIPAIIDLSEEMMAELTGRRVHAVHVRFEVLSWGHGDVYRDSGPGYALAFGHGG
ncbi:hypothetical protein [Actinomadura rupiterrae]|uniref:hypothetical protein n=1 Tax=Actinomadura rupiterrae TaxID=559627 RepID=UPI0020A449F4|nr:hypothetical protein [Actinomadura rupiterrae]MCP2342371.1 DNA-binding CsgD family transcriptional regulator [Actinomadura rupiterrae]